MTQSEGVEDRSLRLAATVVRGYGVASGTGPTAPFPEGTIRLQLPHFLARGLDLRRYHPGTVNLRLQRPIRLTHPRYRFPDVWWTDRHGSETFSFSPCTIEYRRERYDGLVYLPHPSTKPEHRHDPDIVEVIAVWIPDLAPGAEVVLFLDAGEVTLE